LPNVKWVVARDDLRKTFHWAENNCRITVYAKQSRELRFLFCIKGIYVDLALVLLSYLLEDRMQLLAPSTPCGREVNDTWFVTQILPSRF
jgi:hypothetical protein